MTTLQIFEKEVKVSLSTSQAFPGNKELYITKYNFCKDLLEKLEAAKGTTIAQDKVPYYVQCVWNLYVRENGKIVEQKRRASNELSSYTIETLILEIA